MRLLIHRDYKNLCRWTADYIIRRITAFAPSRERPFVLALPTGSTPLGVYQCFINACREGKLSFSNVITFNLDEYQGIPADHPLSYARFMQENLFSSVDIPPQNTHIPDGMAKDPQEECDAYEQAINEAGGIELLLGGNGNNGHIAFNEPGSSFHSRTRIKTLSRETRVVNARFFDGDPEKVPLRALTVCIGTIMDAREAVFIASGRQKARAIQAAVEGGINQYCPLSCLQMHPRAIIVCDDDAAEELKYSTVRYFKDLESSELERVDLERSNAGDPN